MVSATQQIWKCIGACLLLVLSHPSVLCSAHDDVAAAVAAPGPSSQGKSRELASSAPPMATVYIAHISGVAGTHGKWTLNNFMAFAGDKRLATSADSLYHKRFPQGHIFAVQVPADVTSIAFSTQDAKKFLVYVGGATNNRKSPGEVFDAVHWSNGRYRDGGGWTAADNNKESHWAYNTVTISKNPTTAFKRWSQLPKQLATITIEHVSGIAYHGRWSLNNFFAFAGNERLETDQDAALKAHQWFPKGHVETIKVRADMDLIAFSTQDASKFIVKVQGATGSRQSPAGVINAVHWSNGRYRDGGQWTAADNNNPTHWAYNTVSISRSNPSSAYKRWSQLPWEARRLLRSPVGDGAPAQ